MYLVVYYEYFFSLFASLILISYPYLFLDGVHLANQHYRVCMRRGNGKEDSDGDVIGSEFKWTEKTTGWSILIFQKGKKK